MDSSESPNENDWHVGSFRQTTAQYPGSSVKVNPEGSELLPPTEPQVAPVAGEAATVAVGMQTGSSLVVVVAVSVLETEESVAVEATELASNVVVIVEVSVLSVELTINESVLVGVIDEESEVVVSED